MSQPVTHTDSADSSQLHQALVDELKERGLINTPAVEAAFRAVPRHLFLPDIAPEQVYQDQHIVTKYDNQRAISSSSQPAIMAIMLEQLALAPGQRVLEIGAGTGYNAALIAHIVGPAGSVVTLDVDQDIIASAQAHLKSAGYEQVLAVQHDGAFGYPALAPYDRIILTVGAWDVLPAWREQLARDGRIVLPLTILPGLMLAIALQPVGNRLESVSARPCGFMPLRGESAHPTTWHWPQPQISVLPREHPESVISLTFSVDKEWNRVNVTWQAAKPEVPGEESAPVS